MPAPATVSIRGSAEPAQPPEAKPVGLSRPEPKGHEAAEPAPSAAQPQPQVFALSGPATSQPEVVELSVPAQPKSEVSTPARPATPHPAPSRHATPLIHLPGLPLHILDCQACHATSYTTCTSHAVNRSGYHTLAEEKI